MTLATKAARGAGAPPAQAAMFGQATLCHLIAGRDQHHLSDALQALPSGPILDMPVLFQSLIEQAVYDEITVDLVHSHLLQSYLDAQPFHTGGTHQDGRLSIQLRFGEVKRRTLLTRITLPQGLAALLQDLAAKTLVAETATSRLSGAGAGLTDND